MVRIHSSVKSMIDSPSLRYGIVRVDGIVNKAIGTSTIRELKEFEGDPELYVLKLIKYVGVEAWQIRNCVLKKSVPPSFITTVGGNYIISFKWVECDGAVYALGQWVEAGSVYDYILICDDPEYAKQVVEELSANREMSYCLRVLSSLTSKKMLNLHHVYYA
nr:hypothetical protein CFP56_06609 [Quercus suber]